MASTTRMISRITPLSKSTVTGSRPRGPASAPELDPRPAHEFTISCAMIPYLQPARRRTQQVAAPGVRQGEEVGRHLGLPLMTEVIGDRSLGRPSHVGDAGLILEGGP